MEPLGAVVAVAEVAEAGDDVFLLVEAFVDGARDDADERRVEPQMREAFGAADDVRKDDALLRHAGGQEHAHRRERRAACGEHRVAEQDLQFRHARRQLGVQQRRQRRRFVALDEYLGRLGRRREAPHCLEEDAARAHDIHDAQLRAIKRPHAVEPPARRQHADLDDGHRGERLFGEQVAEAVCGVYEGGLGRRLVAERREQASDGGAAQDDDARRVHE
eukprot:CAMPEP_0184106506 /NCGR_PEP_ID=MMETSP0974-20121125/15413_1 /TAXON_ID=483370 /ORGANISM="non described non described, Strain CCMP2097" /LENGTH=218 /DNA_ID=CAMNT_0026409527 /DNA_START=115 /DNA_END=768 /DNA_ORIENTATION=-